MKGLSFHILRMLHKPKINPDVVREVAKQTAWALFNANYPLTEEQWAILNVSDDFKLQHGYHADGRPKR